MIPCELPALCPGRLMPYTTTSVPSAVQHSDGWTWIGVAMGAEIGTSSGCARPAGAAAGAAPPPVSHCAAGSCAAPDPARGPSCWLSCFRRAPRRAAPMSAAVAQLLQACRSSVQAAAAPGAPRIGSNHGLLARGAGAPRPRREAESDTGSEAGLPCSAPVLRGGPLLKLHAVSRRREG